MHERRLGKVNASYTAGYEIFHDSTILRFWLGWLNPTQRNSGGYGIRSVETGLATRGAALLWPGTRPEMITIY